MKRNYVGTVLTGLALGVAPIGAAAQSAGDLVGSWTGTIQGLRIVFHFETADDGTLTGTMDSPDQGAVGIPLSSVALDGSSLTVGVAAAGAEYTATLSEDGAALEGTWSQGPANLPLNLEKSEEEIEGPNRPQEPTEPYPYESRDITFANADAGIELAGTLTLPDGDGPFPGVVLVSGSGPQDRDEALMGHKPFLVLADHLTRQGIAVLRFDDRGVAESGGDFATATSEDFASDATAAVHYLLENDLGVHTAGIVGHSEGGLVGPIAANRSDDVSFIVMLAGPGLPGIDILVAQGELINRAAGTPEAITVFNARIQRGLANIVEREADAAVADSLMREYLAETIASLDEGDRAMVGQVMNEQAIDATVQQLNSPWFRYFLHFDPRRELERLQVPVLSVIGSKDLQVPVGINNPEIQAAFERAGNDDATVLELEGLNHLFQEADLGIPGEYMQIEETFNPVALMTVSDWIMERFGTE